MKPKNMPLVVAHRGASADRPENTVDAYREAVRQRADWIELDVHLLADGALGVYHDNALPDGRLMMDLTAETLPAGMPLLGDALEAGVGACINVEIKAEGAAAEPVHVAATIAAVVAELRPPPDGVRPGDQHIVISSFHLDLLAQIRPALDASGLTGIETAALGWGYSDPSAFIEAAVNAGCTYLHPWHPETTAESVEAAHAAGLRVNVWTVNHPDLMVQLADFGVDGLITDVPAECREVLERWLAATV